MKPNKLIISFFFLASTSFVFAGGPWVKPKGELYLKLSQWWIVYDQHYTDTGILAPNVKSGIFNTSIYAEYGMSNRITTIIHAPLFSRNYTSDLISDTTNEVLVPGEAISSIGDIDLGIQYGLTKPGSKIPISATLIFGLPTGKSDGGTQKNLQTGDGEFNQYLRLDAGTGFQVGSVPAYVSMHAGVNNRGNDFSDELRYGLELGFGLANKKLWLNTKLDAVNSFDNGSKSLPTTTPIIFSNNTEYMALGIEGNYYVSDKIGVSAGFTTALSGRNIAAAPSYSVGVFIDLK